MKADVCTRRGFLKAMGLGAASLALPDSMGASGGSLGEAAADKPNVLFVVIDDLNDWVGCLGGHPNAITPNLDKLAGRGVLFERAYCSSPACLPSRTAVMTGIQPATSGITNNGSGHWRASAVLEDAATIPQHFMASGYSAMGTGKIYHSHGQDADAPSWGEYWPSIENPIKWSPKPPKEQLPACGLALPNKMDWGPLDIAREKMGCWRSAKWANSKLNQKHDKPFFLAYGIYKPHLPWYVPRKYFDMHPLESIQLPRVKEDDLDDLPAMGKRIAWPGQYHTHIVDGGKWPEAVQAYLACASFADDCVGEVINALDSSEYRDNTIIVLWSDHGWHLGEKQHWRKFTLWEESCRNPMMIVAPGITKPGTRVSTAVSLIDIYPTLIELCGLETKEELEGQSLLPPIENPNVEWERPALTTSGRSGSPLSHALRTERWCYIRYSDGGEELYDHSIDENEWYNLANDPNYAQAKRELARWLPK